MAGKLFCMIIFITLSTGHSDTWFPDENCFEEYDRIFLECSARFDRVTEINRTIWCCQFYLNRNCVERRFKMTGCGKSIHELNRKEDHFRRTCASEDFYRCLDWDCLNFFIYWSYWLTGVVVILSFFVFLEFCGPIVVYEFFPLIRPSKVKIPISLTTDQAQETAKETVPLTSWSMGTCSP